MGRDDNLLKSKACQVYRYLTSNEVGSRIPDVVGNNGWLLLLRFGGVEVLRFTGVGTVEISESILLNSVNWMQEMKATELPRVAPKSCAQWYVHFYY